MRSRRITILSGGVTRWFVTFLLINAILAFAPVPLNVRIVSGAAWLLLAPFIARFDENRVPPSPLPSPPSWAFGIALLALPLVYGMKLTEYSAWPLHDEGVSALYAFDNLHGWDGKWNYHFSALPPLYFWLLALLFRVFGVGFFALWLLPALLVLSSISLLASSARRILGHDAAWMVLLFGGLSFWPMQAARFSHSYVLVLFASTLSFRVAIWASEPGERPSPVRLAVSGVVTGAGFLTFFSWPFVAATLGLFLLVRFRGSRWPSAAPGLMTAAWVLPLGIVASPVWIGWIRGDLAQYASQLIDTNFSGNGWLTRLAYLTSIFWTPVPEFVYGPSRGGFLNPIESALVFLGLGEVLRKTRTSLPILAVATGSLLLSVPALMTLPLNLTRVLQWFPPLLLLLVLGVRRLVGSSPRPWRPILILAMVSTAWNLYHLWGPARMEARDPCRWAVHRDGSHAEAYRILADLARRQGPGRLILMPGLNGISDAPGSLHPALWVFTRTFDLLERPRGVAPEWSVLLAPAHHAPYLTRRFPKASWLLLNGGCPGEPPRLVLGIIPAGSVDATVLDRWCRAERAIRPLYRARLSDPDRIRDPAAARNRSLKGWAERRDLFRGDPFLRTLYLEHVYEAGGRDAAVLRAALRESYLSPWLASEAKRRRR